MRRPATLGGAFILVADGVYLFAISQLGATDGTLRVPFVSGAAGALIFGILGLFSVGLLLLLAAIPLVIAVARQRVSPLAGLSTLLTAAAVALAGDPRRNVTSYPVSCWSKEATYGSGTGFLTGDYTWSCVDGKLLIGPSPANPNSGSSPPQSSGPLNASRRLSPGRGPT